MRHRRPLCPPGHAHRLLRLQRAWDCSITNILHIHGQIDPSSEAAGVATEERPSEGCAARPCRTARPAARLDGGRTWSAAPPIGPQVVYRLRAIQVLVVEDRATIASVRSTCGHGQLGFTTSRRGKDFALRRRPSSDGVKGAKRRSQARSRSGRRPRVGAMTTSGTAYASGRRQPSPTAAEQGSAFRSWAARGAAGVLKTRQS